VKSTRAIELGWAAGWRAFGMAAAEVARRTVLYGKRLPPANERIATMSRKYLIK
jgi:hypothetical protein